MDYKNFKVMSARVGVALTLLLCGAIGNSADHGESPATDADPAADIADIFLFPSPESLDKTIASITFGGRPAPRSRIDTVFYCDPQILYTFFIDRADAAGKFDGVPDVEIFVRFGKNAQGECGVQFENVPGAGGTFQGKAETIISAPTGLRGFAGLRNDPFFFDFEGFTALIASFDRAGQNGDVAEAFQLNRGQARRDSFFGRNASTIVFEISNEALAPSVAGVRPKLRAWSTTGRLVM